MYRTDAFPVTLLDHGTSPNWLVFPTTVFNLCTVVLDKTDYFGLVPTPDYNFQPIKYRDKLKAVLNDECNNVMNLNKQSLT